MAETTRSHRAHGAAKPNTQQYVVQASQYKLLLWYLLGSLASCTEWQMPRGRWMSWQSVGFHQTSSLGRCTIWQPLMGWKGEANLGPGTGLALFRLTRVAPEMMDRSLCFPTIPSVIHGGCCMSTASSVGAVLDCIAACVYETVRNGVSMENASSISSMQIFSATSKEKREHRPQRFTCELIGKASSYLRFQFRV